MTHISQAELRRRPVGKGPVRAGAAALAGLVAACSVGTGAADYDTPSGQRVPRWVSLKNDRVNARARPDREARILWIFTARNLPLQVIAEHEDWLRVCDPVGGRAWVWSKNLSSTRWVQNRMATAALLRGAPNDLAAPRVALAPNALARLKVCRQGWCQVAAERRTGWVPLGTLWGTLDYRQCAEVADPPVRLQDIAPHAVRRPGGPHA